MHMEAADVGGITTTEICNISCVMCHFNGPWAPRKQSVLTPDQVKKFLEEAPKGQAWFAGTGEFLMDPNALTHLRHAKELGHQPCLLSNGLLLTPKLIDEILEIGVRLVHISCDEISQDKYKKIRIGGELQKVLDACRYMKSKKREYPDLRVGINMTLFSNTVGRQQEFIDFWQDKVDSVNFNAEYYNIFKFRQKFFEPERRNDCHVRVYLMPTGQMAPCCAMGVYQHHHNVDWLPHIDETTPADAHEYFKKMYADPSSPLRKLCEGCDWWILWARDVEGKTANPGQTAYQRCVPLENRETPMDVQVNAPEPGRVSLPLVAAGPEALAPAQAEGWRWDLRGTLAGLKTAFTRFVAGKSPK